MKYTLFVTLLLFLCNACSYLPNEFDATNLIIDETTDFISLQSTQPSENPIDVLFYPGGLVDPHAYIEALAGLLPSVNTIVIAKHDANLAVLDSNKADDFLGESASDENRIKVLMGHSLGGAMACSYVSNNLEVFDGVVLMAAYPTENFSLVEYQGSVLSLTGSLDGVLDTETFEENKAFLPSGEIVSNIDSFPTTLDANTTVYYEIEGGNHAQFGSYGEQNGDGIATISADNQQQEVTEVILAFFKSKSWL